MKRFRIELRSKAAQAGIVLATNNVMDATRLARYAHSPRLDRLWSGLAEGLCSYFRIEISGLEHVPRKGPVIVIANHSGFAGADAILLSHLIHSRSNREVRVLAHSFSFRSRG